MESIKSLSSEVEHDSEVSETPELDAEKISIEKFSEELKSNLEHLNSDSYVLIEPSTLRGFDEEQLLDSESIYKEAEIRSLITTIISPDLQKITEQGGSKFSLFYKYPFVENKGGYRKSNPLLVSRKLDVVLGVNDKPFVAIAISEGRKESRKDEDTRTTEKTVADKLLQSCIESVVDNDSLEEEWSKILINYLSNGYISKDLMLESLSSTYRDLIEEEGWCRKRGTNLVKILKLMEEYNTDILDDSLPLLSLNNDQRKLLKKLHGMSKDELSDEVEKEISMEEKLRATYHKGAILLLSRLGISNYQFMMYVESENGWELQINKDIKIMEDKSKNAYRHVVGTGGYSSVSHDSTTSAELDEYSSFISKDNSLIQDRELLSLWKSEFQKQHPEFPIEFELYETGSFHEVWRYSRVLIPFEPLFAVAEREGKEPRELIGEWGRFLKEKISSSFYDIGGS